MQSIDDWLNEHKTNEPNTAPTDRDNKMSKMRRNERDRVSEINQNVIHSRNRWKKRQKEA